MKLEPGHIPNVFVITHVQHMYDIYKVTPYPQGSEVGVSAACIIPKSRVTASRANEEASKEAAFQWWRKVCSHFSQPLDSSCSSASGRATRARIRKSLQMLPGALLLCACLGVTLVDLLTIHC